jgi:hypothetical protein
MRCNGDGGIWPQPPTSSLKGVGVAALAALPQMNACLRANKAKLSEPRRKVVESRGG